MKKLLMKMSDHDANEERRDIKTWVRKISADERRDYTLSWSWMWLSWEFGPGWTFEPYSGNEPWGVWFGFGPFCLEFHRSDWVTGSTIRGQRPTMIFIDEANDQLSSYQKNLIDTIFKRGVGRR